MADFGHQVVASQQVLLLLLNVQESTGPELAAFSYPVFRLLRLLQMERQMLFSVYLDEEILLCTIHYKSDWGSRQNSHSNLIEAASSLLNLAAG